MASQNLNIKVKLDFDETSLKNLNLGTVRVDPDVNHFKSKLRSALNGNFKITPKINTKGISNQLNNIKNDMREFRNAAKDPIKINFDVDKDVLSDLAVVSRQLEKIQKASASATKMKLSGMSGISKTGDDLSTLVSAARKANKEITALEAKKKALESTGRSLSDKDALKLGDFQKQAQEYSNAIEKIIAEKQKLDEQALRSTFKNSEKPTEEETKALAALKEKYATMRAQTEEYSKIGAAQKFVTENNAIQKAQLEAQTQLIKEQSRAEKELVKSGERLVKLKQERKKLDQLEKEGQQTVREEDRKAELEREIRHKQDEFNELAKKVDKYNPDLVKETKRRQNGNSSEIQSARAEGTITAQIRARESAYKSLEGSIKRQISLEKELARATDTAAKRNTRRQLAEEREKEASIRKQIRDNGYQSAAHDRRVNALSEELGTTRVQARKQRKTRIGFNATMDVYNMAQQGAYAVASAVSALSEVDAAITRVTKVANAPQKDIDAFTKSIYKNASAVGKTAPEYASAVEQWITTGKSLKQSIGLAKDSVMGSFVGNVDVNDMVKYMAVPLNSFRKEGLKSKDIINSMNQVSNKNAIEMEDLGQAYSKASSVVASTGTTFSQLTGMITGAQEATRAGGDIVGRSIKAISLNFSKMSSGVTKTDKKRSEFFHGLGVDLKTSDGKMKSTYQIMNDLSKVWGKLSKQQKSDAALYAAGKEHSNQFTGMLDNWKTVQKAMRESQGQVNLVDKGHGSAFQEFEKQQQSVQFHLATLKNSWTQMLNDVVGGREGLNKIVDTGTSVVNVLDNLANNKIFRGTAMFTGAIVAIGAFHKALSGLASAAREVTAAKWDNLTSLLSGETWKNWTADMNERKRQLGIGKKPDRETRHVAERNKMANAVANAADVAEESADIAASRRERYSLNRNKSKIGKRKVKGDLATESRSIGNVAKEVDNLGNVSYRTEGRIGGLSRVGGKVASGMGKMAAAASLVSGVLGPIGVILDGIAIGMTLLELTGAKPFESIRRAINPTKAASDDLNKALDTTAKQVDKIQSGINNNPVFNGAAISVKKSGESLSDAVNNASYDEVANNKLNDENYKKYKDFIKDVNKKYHLHIDVESNNLDVIKDQLKDVLADIKEINNNKIVKGAKDNKTEAGKLNDVANKNKTKQLYEGNKKYQEEKNGNDAYLVANGYMSQREYNQKLREAQNAAWMSSDGRKIENENAAIQKNIRSNIRSIGRNVDSGNFSKDDYKGWDKNTLQQATIATGQILRNRKQEASFLDKINKKQQNGEKLTKGEATKLNHMGVSVRKDTSKWTQDERDKFNQARNENSDGYTRAKQNLDDLLTTRGIGKKRKKEIEDAYESGDNKKYISLMGREGEFGKSMLGLSAMFEAQYGKSWNKVMQSMQGNIDKFNSKNGRTTAASRALVDGDGIVDTSKISQINALGSKNLKNLHIADKDGQVDLSKLLTNLQGVKGSSNPLGLLQDLVSGKADYHQTGRYQSNLDGGKFNSKSKDAKKVFNDYMKNNKGNYDLAKAEMKENGVYQGDIAALDKQGKIYEKARKQLNNGFSSKADKKAMSDLAEAMGSKSMLKDYLKRMGFDSKSANKWVDKNIKKDGSTKKGAVDDDSSSSSHKGGKSGKGKGKSGKSNKNKDDDDDDDSSSSSSSSKRGKGGKNNKGGKGSKNDKKNDKITAPGIIPTVEADELKNTKSMQAANKALKAMKNGQYSALTKKQLAQLKKDDKTAYDNYQKAVKNFNKADKNNDGKLSKAEQKKYEQLGKKKADAENKGRQSENKKNKKKEDKEDTKSNKSNKSNKSKKKNYTDENGKKRKLSDSKGSRLTAKEKRDLSKKVQAEQKEMARLAKKYNAADKNNDGKLSAKEKRNLAKKLNEEAKIEAQAAKKKNSKVSSSSKSSSSKAKSKSKQKAIKVPIKAEDKTKTTLNKIKSSAKKAKIKVQVKAEDKTKSTLNKIKSKGKRLKVKVPITARDKTSSTFNKIKSKGKSLKVKVPITATDHASSKINSIKAKAKGTKVKITISATDNATPKINAAKAAISALPKTHQTNINATDNATPKANSAKSAIQSIPKSHKTKISLSGADAAIQKAQGVAAAINAIPSTKSVSINVSKSETVTVKKKDPSVGISSSFGILGNVDASYAVNPNPFRSMSVATDNPDVVSAMNGTAANMGVRDYSEADDTKVNEEYWRYMGKELYKGLPLDEQASKLENAVTQADEDMNKLINIARQKIDLDRKQLAYQNEMRGAYQNQLNDVMGKLRGYGFRTNGNQITNLDIAKNFKGDKASKVDELLSTYQNVYQNLSDVTKKIDELNTDIWQQNKNIQDYQEEIESQAIEKAQRELEMVQRSVEYSKNLADKVIDSLSEKDYAMKLGFSAKEINEQSAGLEKLIGQFNKLSAMTFSKKEQAEKIEDSLNDLRQTILDTADSVLELQNNMKQAEIDQYTENLTSFTDTINNNIDRLKSNVQQLQDGLLSGTTFDDLLSSNLSVTDFEQQSALSRQMQQRIDLEKQLDSAMDAFAKKNVDRQNNVAAAQLRVEQNKYAQMLNLAKDYAKGYVGEINTKFATYATSTGQANLNDITIGGGQRSVEYTKAMVKYQDELVKLREEYNKQLKAAANDEQRSRINQKFAVQQMDMQRELYQQIINSNLQAIDDMQKKLKTEDLTTEQRQTLKESIAQYEKDNIDAQNNIKDIIKERFEYENTLIQDQLDKYQKVTDTVSNLVTLAKTLQMQPATQAKLLEQQYKSIEKQYNTYIALANKLREQQSGYGVNSFEWNTLQKQIDEMDSRVNQSIADLLEASRSQFENTMEATSKEFEKSINGGRTADRTKFEDDIWIDGVSKQLKLEQLRQKSIELENEVVKKRIEALDAQSRMSKIQADYVDKQIDVLNAQQALDNTLGKRDTKVLTQGEDGKFNWTYMANQDDVDTARENLTQAKVDMEDYKKQMKSQFVDAVEKVIDGAKTGELNIDEVKTRLQQLQDAYGVGILDDIPEYNAGQLENIIQQYTDYVNRNKDILGKYGDSKAVGSLTGYQEILQGFTDQFKVVGKEISEMFGQQLRDALKLDPNLSPRIPNAPTQTLSMVIQHQTLEFPNVTDPTGFEEAIKNLPQIAKQQVQSKSL